MIKRWRRLDEPGLEVLRIEMRSDGVEVKSSVIHAGKQPFGLLYEWASDDAWRTRAVSLHLRGKDDRSMMIERSGMASWRIDGTRRSDLDGCDEIDVSATPFCNSLAIRRLEQRSGELTTVYVDVPAFSVVPSRQRYEQLGSRQWRYVDLSVAAGFQAVLDLDEDGLVSRYEGLFEAL
jgi:uncharacterized protein